MHALILMVRCQGLKGGGDAFLTTTTTITYPRIVQSHLEIKLIRMHATYN